MSQPDDAVYVISAAAELAGLHPQTLRMYERKGLLRPSRTAGNTRRYSQRDIERLREIQRLTQEVGVNLAGVARVMELELRLRATMHRVEHLERELADARRESTRRVQDVHRSYRRDLVLYSPPAQLVPRSAR